MVARTATWLAIGRLTQNGTALLLPIILVRTLTQTEYGLYKQIDLAAALLVPLILLGFDKSVTYFVPRKDSVPSQEISTAFVGILALASGMLLLGILRPEFFGRIFGTVGLPTLVLAICVYTASGGITDVAMRSLLAAGQGRTAAMLPAAIGLPRTIVLVLVALLASGLGALLRAIIAFEILSILTVLIVLHRRGCLRPEFRLPVLRKHLKYGGTLSLLSLISTWGNRMDRYLVSSGLGPQVFAIYAVGKTRLPLSGIPSQALGEAIAPRFSRLESENRHQEMATLWRSSAEALLPMTLLLALFLSSTAQWSIPIVFTETYREAVPIFRVFAFACLLQALVGLDPILRALSAFRFLAVVICLSLLANLIACMLALRFAPLAVLAGVQLLLEFGALAARLLYVRRRLAVPWSAILPVRGLRLTLLLGALGLGLTMLIDLWLGEDPRIALVSAGLVWGALLAFNLWRQGLWKKLLAGRRRSQPSQA